MAVLNGWINGFHSNNESERILSNLTEGNGIIANKVYMNGEVGYHFYINHNHFGFSFQLLLDKMNELILAQNLEFHGLIYLFDDENPIFFDTWQVWVISKGKIEKKEDCFLSPYSEKVADYEEEK